ncbi:hypothetical protein ACQY0O_002490 [Thecaphora frezii]
MSDSGVSSYFANLFPSQSTRNALFLGSIALGSSIATAAAIFGSQRLSRKKKRKDLGDSVRNAATNPNAERRTDPNLLHHHPRDESSSTTTAADAPTPRYLANLQQNHLRPTSGLRQSHSFNTSSSSPAPALAPSSRRPTTLGDPQEWDESLIREQLSRNYSFLGDDGMQHIRDSFVIVVGAGGVGSWAALMLLRSGVGRLRLIDFDQVSLSSLNRHACATLADVGRPKVVCCAEKFGQIAPWAKLEAWVELFRGDEAPRLLGGNPTYVVDAIDNIDTKVELLRYCAENKIKVISSMGAGAKSDPSRIQISDISTTSEDPLARSVRRRLRALGIPPIPPKEVEEAAKREQEANDATGAKKAGAAKKTKAGAKAAKKLGPSQVEMDKTPVRGGASANDSSDDGSPSRYLGSGGAANARSPLAPSPLGSSPMPSGTTSSDSLRQQTASGSSGGIGSTSSPLPNVPRAHSRRASSVSSFGSGAYATPMMTPSDEMAALLPPEEQGGLAPLDGAVEGPTEAAGAPKFDDEVVIEDDEQPTISEPAQPVLEAPAGQDTPMSHHASRASELEEIAPGSMSSSPAVSRLTSYCYGGQSSNDANTAPLAATEGGEASAMSIAAAAVEPTYFIPCVYSTEKSDTRLLPLDEEEFQKGSVDELAALEDFRVRILPVLGPLPAMFGLAVATYIICELAGHKMEPLAFKGRRKLYEKIYNDLSVTESRNPVPGTMRQAQDVAFSGPRQHLPFNLNDVSYLFEEVFRGRSVVPPYESLSSAQLERWDSTLPISYSNIALFSRAQAKIHEREVLQKGRSPTEVWGSETAKMVKKRMANERVSGFFR